MIDSEPLDWIHQTLTDLVDNRLPAIEYQLARIGDALEAIVESREDHFVTEAASRKSRLDRCIRWCVSWLPGNGSS
jgi:hypothetical protein